MKPYESDMLRKALDTVMRKGAPSHTLPVSDTALTKIPKACGDDLHVFPSSEGPCYCGAWGHSWV